MRSENTHFEADQPKTIFLQRVMDVEVATLRQIITSSFVAFGLVLVLIRESGGFLSAENKTDVVFPSMVCFLVSIAAGLLSLTLISNRYLRRVRKNDFTNLEESLTGLKSPSVWARSLCILSFCAGILLLCLGVANLRS